MRSLAMLLRSRARATGTGKKKTSWTSAISSVLNVALQKAGSANAAEKLAKPTQTLCMYPRYGW